MVGATSKCHGQVGVTVVCFLANKAVIVGMGNVGTRWKAESRGIPCHAEWEPVIAGHVYDSVRPWKMAIYILKKTVLTDWESCGLRVVIAVSDCIRRSLYGCSIRTCSSSDTLEHRTYRL